MPMTVTTFSDVHTTGVEEAEACLPLFMHLDHHPAAGFAFHQHTVACGPFSVEETRCTDGVHLDLLDQFEYAVGVPVRGPLHTEHRGQELDLGPGRAAIFAPSLAAWETRQAQLMKQADFAKAFGAVSGLIDSAGAVEFFTVVEAS